MRTIEDYSEPSKTMKKSTLKIAIFIHFHIFCYVIRVGKFSHCAKAEKRKRFQESILNRENLGKMQLMTIKNGSSSKELEQCMRQSGFLYFSYFFLLCFSIQKKVNKIFPGLDREKFF